MGVGRLDEVTADAKAPIDEAADDTAADDTAADDTASDAKAPDADKTADGKAPDGAAIELFPGLIDSERPMQIDLPGMSFSHLDPIAEFHFRLSRRHQSGSSHQSSILTCHSQ